MVGLLACIVVVQGYYWAHLASFHLCAVLFLPSQSMFRSVASMGDIRRSTKGESFRCLSRHTSVFVTMRAVVITFASIFVAALFSTGHCTSLRIDNNSV